MRLNETRKRIFLLLAIYLSAFILSQAKADTPPVPNPNVKLQDGFGNKITSTSGTLNVSVANALNVSLSSSPAFPLFNQLVFNNNEIDPRDKNWFLNQGSDAVTAYQGGSWLIPLPVGAATSALQGTANSLLTSIDTKLTAPISVSVNAIPLPNGASTEAKQDIQITAINLLNSKIPTNGQKTKSQSIPVVLSSDSDPLPVSGSFSFSDPSVSDINQPFPAKAQFVGGSDGTRLRAFKVSTDGTLITNSSGFVQPISGTVTSLITSPVSVNVLNYPTTQAITGAVAVTNFPSTYNVTQGTTPWITSGAVTIQNSSLPVTGPLTNAELRAAPVVVSGSISTNIMFPSSMTVNQGTSPWITSGTTQITNFPLLTSVLVTNPTSFVSINGIVPTSATGITPISGNVTATLSGTSNVNVLNLPSVQTVSGSLSVNNFPSIQVVSGSLSRNWVLNSSLDSVSATITNFPSIQTVSTTGTIPVLVTNPVSNINVLNFPSIQAVSTTGINSVSGFITVNNPVTSVSVNNLVSVSTTGTIPVSLLSVPTHPVTQSGSWNVGILGTVPTSATGTTSIAGTVSVANTVSVSTTGTNSVSGFVTVNNPITGFATEATLASLNSKVTAVNTNAVSISASALPSGAATSANQTTANASLSSIDTKLTAPLSISSSGFKSVSNSTTVQLAAGASFTGIGEDVLRYQNITVSIFSNQILSFRAQWSNDNLNWIDDDSNYANTTNNFKKTTYGRVAQYFRIFVVNTSGSTTTGFFVSTIYDQERTKPSSHRIGDPISQESDAELVKASITGLSLIPSAPASAVVTTTSTQILGTMTNRKGLIIQNLSNNIVYLGLGFNAVLNSGIALYPGGNYSAAPLDFYSGVVNAISTVSGSVLSIQEYQ